MNRCRLCLFLFASLHLMLCATAAAQSYEELNEDIQRRSEVISRFKEKGELSEGPDGLLTPEPGASTEAKSAADEENTARRKMFALVAEKTGETVEKVARSFAERVPPEQRKTSQGSQPSYNHPSPSSNSNTPPPAPPSSSSFVPVQPGSSLPLKILTRPESPLFSEPSADAKIITAQVPAFTAWVVAAMREGWYQVTEDVGRPPSGWMKAADVMEWRHHMVVSFTHPGSRSRSIFFNNKASLTDLMRLPREARRAQWEQFLDLAPKGKAPQVAGLEPEGWLREKNQFYLLPILEQDSTLDGGQELMLLKVAAASRARGVQKRIEPQSQPVERLPRLDIVFVMDLTRSMGPFVDATLKMLSDIAGKIGDASSDAEAVRFGLWGYRDDPKLCPGIGFNTKNFTPELQDLRTFLKTLESVGETKTDSIDYAEDVFAGVYDAISHTQWREGSAKTLLLVGDAPGRGPGETEPECQVRPKPEGSASGMDAQALRVRASEKSVYLSAFYLEAPKWKDFTALAERQFRTLAANPGSTNPDFKLLNAQIADAYVNAASSWASQMAANLKTYASEGKLPEIRTVNLEEASPEEAGRAMADNIFRNAFIEWHSTGTQLDAPRDIEGWVADKEPTDPSRMTLEPGVLLTKTQLSGLRDRVSDLLDAMQRQQIEGGDFFRQLQAVVTISGRDPGRLGEALSLMESRYFPDFLTGLPYKSKIMAMSRDDWREMGADRANQLANEMLAKVRYYSEIYTDASKWQRLNTNADAGDFVAPVPIDMLP